MQPRPIEAKVDPTILRAQIGKLLEVMLHDNAHKNPRHPSERQKAILQQCQQALAAAATIEAMEKVFYIATAAIVKMEEKGAKDAKQGGRFTLFKSTIKQTAIGERLREVLRTDKQFAELTDYFIAKKILTKDKKYGDLRRAAYEAVNPGSVATKEFLEKFFLSNSKENNDDYFSSLKEKLTDKPEVQASNETKETKQSAPVSSKHTFTRPEIETKKPAQEAKRVLFVSLDFDGCLAFDITPAIVFSKLNNKPTVFSELSNQRKYEHIKKYAKDLAQLIVSHNKALLDSIAEQVKQGNYEKLSIAIGSNRQSFNVDLGNALRGAGSVYPVFDEIEYYLKEELKQLGVDVALDTYSMSDTYTPAQDKTQRRKSGSGDEFARAQYDKDTHAALQEDYKLDTLPDDPDWMFDDTKVSILYHQMQRVREKNPKAERIDFHFYDDRRDIIEPLQEFFQKNPRLIPEGVVLHLHNYGVQREANGEPLDVQRDQAGKPIPYHNELKETITGRGVPDPNYKDTVVALAGMALEKLNPKWKSLSDEEAHHHFLEMKKAVYDARAQSSIHLVTTAEILRQVRAGRSGHIPGTYKHKYLEEAIQFSAKVKKGMDLQLSKTQKKSASDTEPQITIHLDPPERPRTPGR